MSSPFERQLAQELERRGHEAAVPSMSQMADAAVRDGARLRRRRQLGVVVGTSLAAAGITAAVSVAVNDKEGATSISGPSGQQGSSSTSTRPAAGDNRTEKTPPPSSKGPARETTPCKEVPSPPAVEMDTLLDKNDGVLRYSYSDPKTGKLLTYMIAYRDDPDCRKDPALRRLIDHVLDAADY